MDKTLQQKLLGQLTPADAALVQWLADQVGIRQDDPVYPFLIVLHHYQTLLGTLPAQLEQSAETALNQALAVYGTIQTQLEASSTQLQAQLEGTSTRWQQGATTTTQQLQSVHTASQQLKQALEQLYTAQATLGQTLQQEQSGMETLSRQLAQTQRRQWLQLAVWLGTALVCSGAWYGAGVQAKTQAIEQKLGHNTIEYTAQFWQWNTDRLIRCQKDHNPKCTFWIAPPNTEKQP